MRSQRSLEPRFLLRKPEGYELSGYLNINKRKNIAREISSILSLHEKVLSDRLSAEISAVTKMPCKNLTTYFERFEGEEITNSLIVKMSLYLSGNYSNICNNRWYTPETFIGKEVGEIVIVKCGQLTNGKIGVDCTVTSGNLSSSILYFTFSPSQLKRAIVSSGISYRKYGEMVTGLEFFEGIRYLAGLNARARLVEDRVKIDFLFTNSSLKKYNSEFLQQRKDTYVSV